MDNIYKILNEGFEFGHRSILENDRRFAQVEASLEAYLDRAKEAFSQKNGNPKPVKRFMRTIQDENEDEEEPKESGDLRPVRTAKSKANLNLKELPLGTKMRNDNSVSIKVERSSSLIKSNSRESVKENRTPNEEGVAKRRSPDEGIQSAAESDTASVGSAKRSNSVEFISTKLVEIDITEDDVCRMPPPAVQTKPTSKKTRTKQRKETIDEPTVGPIRVTRSKIKQEKLSVDHNSVQKSAEISMPPPAEPLSKPNESIAANVSKKGGKKKYPLPILIKIEPEDPINSKGAISSSEDELPLIKLKQTNQNATTRVCDETFDVQPQPPTPAMNETVTIEPANPNSTVTLSQNPHDSLMTEDNDDADVSMQELPPPVPKKLLPPPAVPPKLKKNEVFNPYLSSPVKQKVQLFEKHAQGGGGTPNKYNTMPAKYSVLKNGTPSKIALYSKTTPISQVKGMKASAPMLLGSSTSAQKAPKMSKKMTSLSQETLDEAKKVQLLEEKRKAREEKQKQAQIAREAMEKEKRDQVLKLQMERDEKYRKIIKEKEEKQRMEALKKKMLKENQAKKYAEEKAKKEFMPPPKPVEAQSSSKMNDSLLLKMQKQIIIDKAAQQMKAEAKNTYSFDMLHTDDSTDDESSTKQKRPPQPEWSKKHKRRPLIVMQSHIQPSVLDSLYSVQPISVDLREIFPSIDSRKLVRNSSAIWRTPPKHY